MFSKLVCSVILACLVVSEAVALCYTVGPGLFVINHRSGFLQGGNFRASARCTRNTPKFVFWRGGVLCENTTIYGRFQGRSFSCSIRRISR
jgi:hypothetical protein